MQIISNTPTPYSCASGFIECNELNTRLSMRVTQMHVKNCNLLTPKWVLIKYLLHS